MKLVVLVLAAGIAVLGLWAWSRTSTPRVVASSRGTTIAPPAAEAPASGDLVVERGDDPGVVWRRPPRWSEAPPRPTRWATYEIPAAPGDPAAGLCAVYYFGPGQGGGVEDNVERWVGEFDQASKPRRATRTVAGRTVATVFVRGTYAGHAERSGDAIAAPDWALLGAIVEGPTGAVFFKLTGPARTVEAAEGEFDALLASLRERPGDAR